MQSKGFFPKFWRQPDVADAPHNPASTEAPVNKSQTHPAEGLTGPKTDLLSYEDIYRAAGILSPRSGYGIHKVVDMLNSDRIRNLSPDIKRASVLMALDAAGTSAEDLLQDATRRQQALSSYEGAAETTGGIRGAEGPGKRSNSGGDGAGHSPLRRAHPAQPRSGGAREGCLA